MMNAVFFRIVFVAFMLCHAYPLMAHVALDYPTGGETFIVGESITIQWHIVVPHNQQNWDLLFSPDGGVTWDTIQLDIPTSNLSYEWEIPDNLTSLARVRVIQDNEDQNYQDDSMDFTILPNTNPPLLDAPANDTVIECSIADQEAAIQAWLNNHGGASATNYCGDLVWTHDFPGLSNGCGATGSAEVTFTATDNCGMVTTNATLVVIDATPPVILMTAIDLVVESDGQGNTSMLNAWLNTKGGAQASDACSNVIWTNNYTGLGDGCGSTGSTTVIFMATDACGNQAATTATFTIVDHTSPVIIIPSQDTSFSCTTSNQQQEIQLWLDDHGGGQATDVGGDVLWSHNYSGLSDGCGETGSATVIFTATDECGNSITADAIIAIEDHDAPVISIEAKDTTIMCGQHDQAGVIQDWLHRQGGASASELCGTIVWTNDFTALSDTCGPAGIHTVTFTATDECGHNSATQAILTIMDSLVTVLPVVDDFDFEVYPNPASDMLTVNFDQNETGQLHLILLDAYGKRLWSDVSTAMEITIPISYYPPGAYFVQVLTKQGSYSKKVIIY